MIMRRKNMTRQEIKELGDEVRDSIWDFMQAVIKEIEDFNECSLQEIENKTLLGRQAKICLLGWKSGKRERTLTEALSGFIEVMSFLEELDQSIFDSDLVVNKNGRIKSPVNLLALFEEYQTAVSESIEMTDSRH
jgi:hypothetical protein